MYYEHMSNLDAILAALSNQSPNAKKRAIAELKRSTKTHAKAIAPGHVEAVLPIADDRVGVPAENQMSKRELLEQKSNEYSDLFMENPDLELKTVAYVAPVKVLSKSQITYRAKVAQAKAEAAEVLASLSGEAPMTPLAREVRKYLKAASDMGIEIPILFKGNKDKKLEALKEELLIDKHEHDSDQIDEVIDSMSDEKRAAFQKVAAEVLSTVAQESEEKSDDFK